MRIVKATPEIRYMALSYVWGVIITVQAETQNITFLDPVGGLQKTWDELPLSILDAIVLAEKIELRCLRVDRLCIVQDDYRAKPKVLRVMNGVYSQPYGAVITASG
ncbi:hypothetical protein F4804DRAFT_338145 [Jackrogersella minutella]|nr:hypothetical protein F4804DRAFT_338145 [Jackrogersella minutella]